MLLGPYSWHSLIWSIECTWDQNRLADKASYWVFTEPKTEFLWLIGNNKNIQNHWHKVIFSRKSFQRDGSFLYIISNQILLICWHTLKKNIKRFITHFIALVEAKGKTCRYNPIMTSLKGKGTHTRQETITQPPAVHIY